jgi:hypothetical protein
MSAIGALRRFAAGTVISVIGGTADVAPKSRGSAAKRMKELELVKGIEPSS